MKRKLAVAAMAVTTVLMTAATAFAQDGYGVNPGGGAGVEGAGGTAFTGGDVATGVIVAIALVAVGIIALVVARRGAAKSVA